MLGGIDFEEQLPILRAIPSLETPWRASCVPTPCQNARHDRIIRLKLLRRITVVAIQVRHAEIPMPTISVAILLLPSPDGQTRPIAIEPYPRTASRTILAMSGAFSGAEEISALKLRKYVRLSSFEAVGSFGSPFRLKTITSFAGSKRSPNK